MIRGKTDHAPRPIFSVQDEDMEKFILKLRAKRNQAESNLKTCESPDVRDALKLRIEQYNIIIQEFGFDPYGKKSKAKF